MADRPRVFRRSGRGGGRRVVGARRAARRGGEHGPGAGGRDDPQARPGEARGPGGGPGDGGQARAAQQALEARVAALEARLAARGGSGEPPARPTPPSADGPRSAPSRRRSPGRTSRARSAARRRSARRGGARAASLPLAAVTDAAGSLAVVAICSGGWLQARCAARRPGLPPEGETPHVRSAGHAEHAANPLDIVEQIVAANEWAFDRRTDCEMAAEAPGKWCDYGLYFSWSREISAMHFTCAFDLKVPEKQRAALYELLALANERLWIGHFGMDSRRRHAAVPALGAAARRARGAAPRASRTWSISRITECERFYPAFQFVLWGGKSPADALQAAMLECVGEA